MKKAIKRGQNQACLSYAERELFGATLKKRAYEIPTCRVVVLRHKANIMASSYYDATPPPDIPDYDDWMGARRHKSVWDDEDDREEE